jgi:hypothetical protein
MNAFDVLENTFLGRSIDELDESILSFPGGQVITLRDLHQLVLILGSIGSGKTNLLTTFLTALIGNLQSGLILVVKQTAIDHAVNLITSLGREQDLILFGPGERHVLNLADSFQSPTDATAALLDCMDAVLGGSRVGGEDSQFWRSLLEICLTNLFCLSRVLCGRFDHIIAAELYAGRASTVTQLDDPRWQAGLMAKALESASSRKESDHGARLAVHFFERDYPGYGERMQGSITACLATVLDALSREPLRTMFSGRSTFSIEDILTGSKICVPTLSVLNSKAGQITNAVLQSLFFAAAPRNSREQNSFIINDECQFTLSPKLKQTLTIIRDFKVTAILATQNISVIDERVGKDAREALFGLFRTKIFCSQDHAATRQWASEQLGKSKQTIITRNRGNSSGRGGFGSSKGTSQHDHWDYAVQPSQFMCFKSGAPPGNIVETIILKAGHHWPARWNRLHPGRGNTVRPII